MISPKYLADKNISVVSTVQKAGEFIVTFPRSYHAGFNHGFNCAESVNFATEDWINFGRQAVESYRFMRSAVFPHEDIIYNAALKPENLQVAVKVRDELERIIKRETELRAASSPKISKTIEMTDQQKHSDPQCDHCGYDCYFSGIVTTCNGGMYCLDHAAIECKCNNACPRNLLIRYTIPTLQQTLASLEDKIKLWTA